MVARNAVGGGLGGSRLGIATGGRINTDFVALANIARELFGDVGAAQDADAQGEGLGGGGGCCGHE